MNDLHIGIMQVTADEMMTQSNRGTQYPTFMIYTYENQGVGSHDDYDEKIRHMDDEDSMCEDCHERYKDGIDLPEDCADCDEECCFEYYKRVAKPVLNTGIFFTESAANRHIEQNDYHYSKPYTYVHSAWRNPELQAVMRMILEFRTDKEKPIPSHYL